METLADQWKQQGREEAREAILLEKPTMGKTGRA